ncbi:aminoglycoside phosphotransferase family protein [Plantactinospora soyae]|uniref:Streptomycin 6-kinase n=1 Tax=Plantactinospora soyae TaxID=1544732 RepID=A0A927M9I5_9ACTN|nr:aminoglycoside phosphotransferase family protein [Plantactinospora soyae]MBE1490324.1 streptomycin 6-kinase [Plantactinospora soyae]
MDGHRRPLRLPAGLDWLRGHQSGRAWLAALPDLVAECAAAWSLRTGPPYDGSYVSLVLPATRPDGTEVVLKVQYPEPDSEHEAAALRHWDGHVSTRLLGYDPRLRALLVERCVPGGPLAEVGAERALTVLARLLPALSVPAGAPFVPVRRQAARWGDELPERWERAGRPAARRLLDTVRELLTGLADGQGEQVLVHLDLHAYNVLRAERRPWLVIDPKPVTGERELSVASIVRDYGLGHGRVDVTRRLDRLSAELGLDRDRARNWSAALALVWAFQDEAGMGRHLETAQWLLARR